MVFVFIISAFATTFSGNISGPGSVMFSTLPGQTLHLTGHNTYTGFTTIQGAVSISTPNNLPHTPILLGNENKSGKLEIKGNMTLPHPIKSFSQDSEMLVKPNFTATLQGDLTGMYPLNITGGGNVVFRTPSIPIHLDVKGNIKIE